MLKPSFWFTLYVVMRGAYEISIYIYKVNVIHLQALLFLFTAIFIDGLQVKNMYKTNSYLGMKVVCNCYLVKIIYAIHSGKNTDQDLL